MKLKNSTWLLMCMCAATFVWQSDDSMAQQFLPQQNESIEIIPFRQSGEPAAFDSPFVQAPSREGSNQRNFDPRSEAFGPREAYEYRRPYRGAYQGEPVGPNARRPHEGQFRQHVDASHPGGSGSRGHGGCRKCRGHHGHRPNGAPGQRPHDLRPREERQFDQRPFDLQPYEDRQYDEGADVAPSLSSISSRNAAVQWRPNPFATGQR